MKHAALLWWLGILPACVDAGQAADTVAPAVVSSEPQNGAIGVHLSAPLRVVFSEALSADAALSPFGLALVTGVPSEAFIADLENPPFSRPGLVGCERALEGPDRLTLRPQAPLAPSTTYSLVATRLLRDLRGNRLPAPVIVTFATGDSGVRLVVPSGLAPVNLAEVVVRFDELPGHDLAPADVRVELAAGEAVPVLPGTEYGDPHLRSVRLLAPLRPGATYRAVVRTAEGDVALPFTTASQPDTSTPSLLTLKIRPFDGALDADLVFGEPIWARLLLGLSPDGLVPGPWFGFDATPTLHAGALPMGAPVFFRLEARDAAGLRSVTPDLALPPLRAVIHPRLRVELSEIVTDAQRDWSDQRCDCPEALGCGVPFDGKPGCNDRVGPADEWVELVNRTGETLDLAAGPDSWRLRVVDETPEVTEIGPSTSLFFSGTSGLRAWHDGDYLVVKTAANSNNDARFELLDPWGSVVDVVALGRGGVPSGSSTGVLDEAVVRVAPGSSEWCHAPATPGGPNAACAR
jgi:hypothetical protein